MSDEDSTLLDASSELTQELYSHRIVVIDDNFNEKITSEWIARILLLDIRGRSKKQPIILLINSYGGSVYGLFGLASVIEQCVCPVITVCIGVAMSAGAMVLMCGTKRYAVPGSRIMVHQNWDILGEKWHHEIMNEAKESLRIYNQWSDLFVKRTGLTKTKVRSLLKIDSYLTPEQAKELNIIDEIGFNIHNYVSKL